MHLLKWVLQIPTVYWLNENKTHVTIIPLIQREIGVEITIVKNLAGTLGE